MVSETVILSQNSKFSHPDQVVFVPNPNPSARAALFQGKLNQETKGHLFGRLGHSPPCLRREGEWRGIQLVVYCSLTHRYHLFLHT